MFKKHRPERVLFKRSLAPILLALFGVFSIVASLYFAPAKAVSAAANNTINFQARLLTSSGAIVPDGTYNVEFKLYNAATLQSGQTQSPQGSCTGDVNCLWVETYTSTNRVTVKAGYLSVQLGSLTPFPAGINWNQSLWLTMNIGGVGSSPTWDGEMNPRLPLTAVPYAFQSQQLSVLSGSNTATLQFASSIGQTTSITLPDPGASTATICYESATVCGFALSSGSANYIQNQNSSPQTANFDINGTGTAGTFNATTALQTGGTSRVDASGDLENIGNISGSGTLQLSGTTGSSYIMSALGLGTTNPQAGAALTLANGSWISGVNAAGTGYVNILSLNSNNEIQLGAALNVDGGIILPTDAGQVTFSDLPIDSSATAGTAESYTFRVGSTNALTVYGQADGSGNAQDVRVAIGSSIAPGYTLDVGGDVNTTGAYRINGTPICTTSGCVAASGSGSYIQNSATVQPENFNVQAASSGSVAGVLRANASGTGDILDLLNGAGGTVESFSSTGSALIKPSTNSTTAFQIQPASSSTPVLNVDTTNGRVGINTNTPAYALDVNGDINSNTAVRVGGISVCTVSDCVPASGSNNYIQNGTTTQTANFSVRSAAINAVTGLLQGASGQTSDILDVQSWNGSSATTLDSFAANGNFAAKGTGTFTANSGSAFQVQNASGSSGVLLNADTTNMRVDIGTAGTPTGQLYVSGSIPSGAVGTVSASSTYGMAVQGHYAYVAGGTTSSALQVFDISNPADMTQVGSYSPGGTTTFNAIAVSGNYAYVSLYDTGAGEFSGFEVLNISNPSDPTAASSVMSLGVGWPIGDIVVSGNYAYVLQTNNSSGHSVLYILNISNPANPVEVSSASWLGTYGDRGQIPNMALSGGYLYAVDEGGGDDYLHTVNISNPASPAVTTTTLDTSNGEPYSIAVQGNYVYIAFSVSNELEVYNINNPISPVLASSVSTGSGSTPYGIYLQGHYAYVVDYGTAKLQTFDVTNPDNTPVSQSAVSTGSGSNPWLVYGNGRYAYVLYGDNEIGSFDLGGAYLQQLQVGGTETGTLQVDSNASVGGDENITGGLSVGGSTHLQSGLGVSGDTVIQGSSTTTFQIQNNTHSNLLTADTSNNAIVLGNDGTPTSLTVRGGAATGSNVSGANLIFAASNGTGSGGSGSIIFQTASTGNSASVPTFVQGKSSEGNATSASATYTTAVTAGNDLIATVGYFSNFSNSNISEANFSVSDSVNGAWTQVGTSYQSADGETVSMFILPNTVAGTPVVTATQTGSSQGFVYLSISEYSGLASSSPVDQSATNVGDSAQIAAGPTAGLAGTNDLIIGAGVVGYTGSISSAGTGFTLRETVSDGSGTYGALGMEDMDATSASGQSMTLNVNASHHWSGMVVAFKGVPGTVPTQADTLQDALAITSSGNVGVGIDNPVAKLQVAGSGLFQTAAGAAVLTVDTTDDTVIIGSGSNTITLNTNGGISASGTAQHTKKIILTPEYAGGVLDCGASTCPSNDVGSMTAGFDSTQKEDYYDWTTTQTSAQTYDVVITVGLPSDWSSWAPSNPLTLQTWKDTTNSSGTITVTGTTGTVDINGSSITPGSATTWTTNDFSLTNADDAANGVMTIRIHMSSNSNSNFRAGNLVLTYNSAF